MLGTAMPKTPVDEDGDATAGEDNVDGASRFGQQHCVYAIAKAPRVKDLA
jgi:hypothetical protein